MSETFNLTFHQPSNLKDFVERISAKWNWEKPMVVKIQEQRRREEQSMKFHAMVNDISRQVPWADQMRTPQEWKNLLVSGHAIITKNETELVRGIEGEILNIRESTSEMTIRRMASLIEYTQAFGEGQGVKFGASKADEEWYASLPEAHR